jgi:outer membrane protein assembly factor BamB
MLALNKETGQKIWSYSLKKGIATSPVLHKGLLIFGESQGSLIILDSGSGKLISSFDPGRGILSPPAVEKKNDLIYFISNEANLYAIKAGWDSKASFSYLR